MSVMRVRYSAGQKVAQYVGLGVLGSGVCAGLLLYRYDERFYRSLSSGLQKCFDGERTHRLAVGALSRGLYFKCRDRDQPDLAVNLWGLQFRNPVGVAAGFDKHGEAVRGLSDIGFGFVEVGSVTPRPQEGTLGPRVLRQAPEEGEAVIKRSEASEASEASEGHLAVRRRLELLRAGGFNGILGINLGQNRSSSSSSSSAVRDYVAGVTQFSHLADFLVINISPSSPSTSPSRQELRDLIQSVLAARRELGLARPPPLLLQISPDLTEPELEEVAQLVTSPDCQVDGLVVSSSSSISSLFSLTGGRLPIVGLGGVSSGAEAWEKVLAGASLVQVGGELLEAGPPLVPSIRSDLSHLLVEAGYQNIQQAVGAAHCRDQ